jgi:Beta-lactamase enzyme family
VNAAGTCRLVASALTFFLLFAGIAVSRAAAPVRPTQQQLSTAAAWAAARKGAVSWAVVDSGRRIHGRHAGRRYPSASVSKSLLLVAALRRVGGRRPVPPDLAGQLGPMIRTSDNGAAHVVFRRLGGDAAFREVARAARLRRLGFTGTWSDLQVSAADVARFFLVADRLVPRRHRAYARRLLEDIHPTQSWGIPAALRGRGWRVLFKGGWRGDRLVHQGALAERDGTRVALAVLTSDNPTHEYGRRTLEGVARRLLGEAPR